MTAKRRAFAWSTYMDLWRAARRRMEAAVELDRRRLREFLDADRGELGAPPMPVPGPLACCLAASVADTTPACMTCPAFRQGRYVAASTALAGRQAFIAWEDAGFRNGPELTRLKRETRKLLGALGRRGEGCAMAIEHPPRFQVMAMHETLLATLPPQSASDRTCYRNLAAWVRSALERDPQHNADLVDRVLALAMEARSSPVSNPRAFFMSILKKDLGYRPAQNQMSKSTTQRSERR